MFNGENKPVYGMSLYKDRKPDKSLLFWWPVFVGASADGKMGFSTGPWEWSKNRDTLPQAFGYYATLWQKDKDGHWKMGVDLGIAFPASEQSNPPLKVSSGFKYSTVQVLRGLADYLAEDNAYNQLLKTVSYRKERFTEDGHLLRSGHKPFTSPGEFYGLDEKGKSFVYAQSYGGVAESKGLFYAYGTVKITTQDGKTADGKYLRVWKDVNSSWKIVLDVLSN
jgi:ketosteroid isomerase-like protein